MNRAGMYKRNAEQPVGKTEHLTDMNIKHPISVLLIHPSQVDLNRWRIDTRGKKGSIHCSRDSPYTALYVKVVQQIWLKSLICSQLFNSVLNMVGIMTILSIIVQHNKPKSCNSELEVEDLIKIRSRQMYNVCTSDIK